MSDLLRGDSREEHRRRFAMGQGRPVRSGVFHDIINIMKGILTIRVTAIFIVTMSMLSGESPRAQNIENNTKRIRVSIVDLASFSSLDSTSDPELERRIAESLRTAFARRGIRVRPVPSVPLDEKIRLVRRRGGRVLVHGFYKAGKRREAPSLYAQIYDAKSGYLIDAYNAAYDIRTVEGVELDPAEFRVNRRERLRTFARRILIRLRANPRLRERRSNIERYIKGSILRERNFPIRKVDRAAASREVFKILAQESGRVSVASNIAGDVDEQPVSVSVITRRRIRLSGARTLNEVLTLFVPGFFMVEDQDDVIAAFRGLAPDNNAKVLLLLNGQNMNTEWFWGPPDGLLQSSILQHIERIEVIRGPGSTTLGQGALLGVINIVTRKGTTFQGTSISAGFGQDGYGYISAQSGGAGKEVPELKTYFFMARSYYPGQALRNQAYAFDKGYEGVDDIRVGRSFDYRIKPTANIDSTFEQPVRDGAGNALLNQSGGLSLVQRRTVYTSGNRLKRSDNTSVFGNIIYKGFELDLLYADQLRDLYNFYRDRNEIQNTVKMINGTYRHDLGKKARLTTKLFFTEDDVSLFSHTGFTMGGVRERRYGGQLLLNLETSRNNRLAAGAEYRKYDMGLPNRANNNFIVNQANETLLSGVNRTHRYVFTDTIDVGSLFLEDYYRLSAKTNLFAAFRFDKQRFWGTNLSPRLGMIHRFSNAWLLRLSYQEGFRGSPGVAYSGGFQKDGHLRTDNFSRIELANIPDANGETTRNIPETRPEKMKSYEAAVQWKFLNHFSLDTVFFYNRIKNIIDVGVIFADPAVFTMPNVGNDEPGDWNGYWFYKNNEGEIRQGGLEASLNYRTKRVSATFSHALVRVITASNQQIGGMYLTSDSESKHFRAYPENVSRLNLLYYPTRVLALSLNVLYYQNWYSPNGNRVEGSPVLNAGVGWRAFKNFEISLTAKNLTDRENPWPMNANAGGRDLTEGAPSLEGRTWWLRATYKF